MNDCNSTNFDLTNIDLEIKMHHLDQIVISPDDPKYLCFEKFDIVMDDDKRTTYSGAHISWHELVLAGNQGNHQNLVPSIALI